MEEVIFCGGCLILSAGSKRSFCRALSCGNGVRQIWVQGALPPGGFQRQSLWSIQVKLGRCHKGSETNIQCPKSDKKMKNAKTG